MTQQIMAVETTQTRQANSSRGPFTIYEVQLGGQMYRARKPVYDQAFTLRGQTVIVETHSEQKGEWTNLFLDSIQPAQQMPAVPAQTSGAVQTEFVPDGVPTNRDLQIWRQTATKVAAHLQEPGESEETFWSNVEKLVWFYETGRRPEDDIPFG